MQDGPEKTAGNFNEFVSRRPRSALLSTVKIEDEEPYTKEQQLVIDSGIKLVNTKINDILGDGNKLSSGDVHPPSIDFLDEDPEHPNWAGYFSSMQNKIALILSKIKSPIACVKVFIHEYVHFISHNGFDDGELATDKVPLAQNNNVGFRRLFGVDIRSDKKGRITSDYFLAFNEAVTEQLAIDIFPGVHETYDNYRDLLDQVMEDAVSKNIGSNNEKGVFQAWSKDRIKSYIYRCFFTGNLAGFTQLLQMTYERYKISEQQFGLMTQRDDLPSLVENSWITNHPNDPPPSPSQVVLMVQRRLDSKTPEDYITDLIDSELLDDDDRDKVYGAEYDSWVKDNNIVSSSTKVIRGKKYNIDTHGGIIYREEEATSILESIRAEFDQLLARFEAGEVNVDYISKRMDELLFDKHTMSMLSDGFRDFYIYKHRKIDGL